MLAAPVLGAASESDAYPSPVESSSQVIASPQRKDPYRRLGAQLQLIQDGKDPAHLQTHRGPEDRKERQISYKEDSLREGCTELNHMVAEVLFFLQTHVLIQYTGDRKVTYLRQFQKGKSLHRKRTMLYHGLAKLDLFICVFS